MKHNFKLYRIIALALIYISVITMLGCKKFIGVKSPPTDLYADVVYTSDGTAIAAVTEIYAKMSSENITSGGISSMSFLPALSSDELTLFSGVTNSTYILYYKNSLTNSSTLYLNSPWYNFFQTIFVTNSAMDGLLNSANLTPSIKQQLMGEVKFVRAFCYFYLVNLYGDVPLVLSTDWQNNSTIPRTSKAEVYSQIISDLKEAQNLLTDKYLSGDLLTITTERTRPNRWAATAMLARAYLYSNKWDSAEKQATVILNANSQFDTVSLTNGVFNVSSKESIWQLQSVTSSPSNSWEGSLFVLPPTGPNSSDYPVYLNSNLINSFEVGDLRKNNWIGSVTPTPGTQTFYFANKYKVGAGTAPVTEYSTVLRIAEQYLIRAEARAQQNKIAESQADLNVIRKRAGLTNTSASTQSTLLAAILHERQVELFTEWGHRWLDLKRTNNVDVVMGVVTPVKGGVWETKDQLYPISIIELQRNPSLTQNPGY